MKLPIISEDAGAKIACGRGTGNNFIISDGLTSFKHYNIIIHVVIVLSPPVLIYTLQANNFKKHDSYIKFCERWAANLPLIRMDRLKP